MSEIVFKEPSKVYRGSYNKKFISKMLNHMGQGKSLASFAGSIGVSPTTVSNWLGQYPEFQEAYEIATAQSMGKWEDIAIDQATGETKGNSSTTTFMMKNLHGDVYKDKQVLEVDSNVVFQIDTGIPQRPKQLEDIPIEVESTEIDDADLL